MQNVNHSIFMDIFSVLRNKNIFILCQRVWILSAAFKSMSPFTIHLQPCQTQIFYSFGSFRIGFFSHLWLCFPLNDFLSILSQTFLNLYIQHLIPLHFLDLIPYKRQISLFFSFWWLHDSTCSDTCDTQGLSLNTIQCLLQFKGMLNSSYLLLGLLHCWRKLRWELGWHSPGGLQRVQCTAELRLKASTHTFMAGQAQLY